MTFLEANVTGDADVDDAALRVYLATYYDASYPPSLLGGGGGGGGSNPHITNLAPATAPLSGGQLTITVTGTGFVTGCEVEAMGAAQPTTFVSATEVTCTYTPTSQGNVVFTVRNPDAGESNDMNFLVTGTRRTSRASTTTPLPSSDPPPTDPPPDPTA